MKIFSYKVTYPKTTEIAIRPNTTYKYDSFTPLTITLSMFGINLYMFITFQTNNTIFIPSSIECYQIDFFLNYTQK